MDSRLFIYLYDYRVVRPEYDLFIIKRKIKKKIHLSQFKLYIFNLFPLGI